MLQIDAPDLALERHISYKDKPVAEFLAFDEAVVTEINRALRNVPPARVRLHIGCGNSESPHDCDVPVEEMLPILRQAQGGGLGVPFDASLQPQDFRCLVRSPLTDH